MRTVRSLVVLLVLLLLPITAYANSTPVMMEGDPGYVLVPEGASPIAVAHETLSFDMREGYGYKARVTVSYDMVHTGREAHQQVMLFPFVTAQHKGFVESVRITADGRDIPFEIRYLENVASLDQDLLMDFAEEGEAFNPTISVESIIGLMNRPAYTPRNFSLDQSVMVRVLELPGGEEAYKAEVSFQIDYERHLILYDAFNGGSLSNDGSGNMSVWVMPKDHPNRRQTAHWVVLGETDENPAVFTNMSDPVIMTLQMTLEEYLDTYVIDSVQLPDEMTLFDAAAFILRSPSSLISINWQNW